MDKYIGDKKILAIQNISETTPIGSEMVLVTFESGTPKKIPKALAERLQTDLPIDATQLRSKWVDPIVNQVIVLMQENDMKYEDMDYLITLLLTSIDDKCSRANAHLYGVDFYPQRTILSVERVINASNVNKILDNESQDSNEGK